MDVKLIATRNATTIQRVLALLFCLVWITACTDAEQQQKRQLEQAVDQVARILNDASRNVMAAAALQSTIEGGGNVLTYVAASLPDKFTHRVNMNRPEAAWSVVLRQAGNADEILVEGYGSDLKKPLFARPAKIGPFSAKR